MDHFYMISKKLSVGEALLLDIIKSLLIKTYRLSTRYSFFVLRA
ncbi:MAG: hypothetical protein RL124_997 [Acidobacteriota bacterium]